jgi:RNA polymerase sigma factor (sigma-70 family)
MSDTHTAITVIDAQQGSQAAFSALCQEFYKPSLLFALKLCQNEDTAKDIAQDAWLVIAKDIKKLREPSVFKAWALKMIYTKYIDLVRKNKKYRLHDDGQNLNELQEQTVKGTWQQEQNIDLVKLINRLPKLEQHCVYLFYLEQMSIAEVATITDTAIGTIKSRLHRARKQLADWLVE